MQARALLDRYDKPANVDQAIALLSSMPEARRDLVAHTLLAEAYWRKFDSTRDATFADRAGKEAGLALASNQSYAPAHVVLAMVNYGQGRYDGALGEAQRAVSLDARNGRAWRELGRVHARLGRRDDAEKELRTAVGLAPDDWTVHNSLGSLYLSVERFDDAVSEFERMQALTPDNTRAYNNLGTAYFNQDRFDKAIEMYERSLSLDRNPTAYSNLGTALYQQGQYADAARSFEGAVALPDAAFLHWFNLGAACYWVPEMRGRAKEAYERAVALGEEARSATPKDLVVVDGAGLGLRGAGAADTRSGGRGTSAKCAQDPRARRSTAASRCRRALDAGHDVRGIGRPPESPRHARAGTTSRLLNQEDRTLAVAQGAAERRAVCTLEEVTNRSNAWQKSKRTSTKSRG